MSFSNHTLTKETAKYKILESKELGAELLGSELWNRRVEVGSPELTQPEPDLELDSEGA